MKILVAFLISKLVLMVLLGCKEETAAEKKVAEEISPGEQIWKANCKVCHLQGVGGAPPIGNKKAWQHRVGQPLDTLVSHALNGYSSSPDTQMPARGGNEQLSDEDIRAAVTYMVSKSK